MEKYKKDLLKKSKMEEKEFNKLLQIILKNVLIIPKETLYLYKKESMDIVKDIDINDALFIACALAYPYSVIWSDDKKLKKQDKIKVLNTKEIIIFLGLEEF
jgi:predicted nucleic acid-binding protein